MLGMLGEPVPDFELPATGGHTFRLAEHRGRPVVIYFYPRDHTPGCTTEGQEFLDIYPQFQELGCDIYGVSRDPIASHEAFKMDLGLPFELLSDADERACALFGVLKDKTMYGKPVRGIERSTFLIDPQGVLAAEWRGVKAAGHAQEVLSRARELVRPADKSVQG